MSEVIKKEYRNSGESGKLYNDSGILLATVDDFVTYMRTTTANDYTAYSVMLHFDKLTIEDLEFIKECRSFKFDTGLFKWKFQGVFKNKKGKSERITFNNCTPIMPENIDQYLYGEVEDKMVIDLKWDLYVGRPPRLERLSSFLDEKVNNTI